VRIDPRAQDDLVSAADRYNGLTPRAGDRFLVAVQQLIDQIVVFPNAGLLIRPGVRQRLVPRFPYFVLYTTDPTNRVVVAGDFRQLPPIVQTEQQAINDDQAECRLSCHEPNHRRS